MKNILFALFIVGITTIGEARVCETGYTCYGVEWACTRVVQRFNTRTDFQNWLNTHSTIEFQVTYVTSTVIEIVYEESCLPTPMECRDATGECDKPL